MGTIKTWDKWADAHSYYGLDVLRVALGVFLFVKGVSFMSNLDLFMSMMRPYQDLPGSWIILHYAVSYTHLSPRDRSLSRMPSSA